MFDGRRVLVVVPARGGSKGIKLKNLREVGGISLVARAGHVASALDFVDRAVVSTDHDDIAAAAEAAGLAAPFRRPEPISGDRIGDQEVLAHALEEMERLDGVAYDVIVMLQPTSPSRKPEHVARTVARLVGGGFDAVWTVSETDSKQHPLKQLVTGDDGTFDFYDPDGARIIARQQLQPVYHRNGIAYAITRDCLIGKTSIKGDRAGYVIIDEPVINIDTELDLAWGDFLFARMSSQ